MDTIDAHFFLDKLTQKRLINYQDQENAFMYQMGHNNRLITTNI